MQKNAKYTLSWVKLQTNFLVCEIIAAPVFLIDYLSWGVVIPWSDCRKFLCQHLSQTCAYVTSCREPITFWPLVWVNLAVTGIFTSVSALLWFHSWAAVSWLPQISVPVSPHRNTRAELNFGSGWWVGSSRAAVSFLVPCGEVTFHNDILWCFITQISYTEEACCEVTAVRVQCLSVWEHARTPGVWPTAEDGLSPVTLSWPSDWWRKKNPLKILLHCLRDSIHPFSDA